MRLLIVEDDRKTAQILAESLTQQGFQIVCAADGEHGFRLAQEEKWDALFVDIMLPQMDGLTMVRKLRAKGLTTPIIVLSARGEVEQRVGGLDAGADDYLAKPFSVSELLARLRSICRRTVMTKPGMLAVADLTLDTATGEVRRSGKRLELSVRERLLLICLLKGEGQVVSRRDILSNVWEYDFDPGTNLVDVYIRRLREKVDREHSPPLIHTERGLGYSLRAKSAS